MSKKKQEPRFWMVWNPDGRLPTYQHQSRIAADREAERLAMANPGQSFFVLKAVGGVTTSVPPLIDIKMRPVRDSEIPF